MEKREGGGGVEGGGWERGMREKENKREDNLVYCHPHLDLRVMSAVNPLESRE